MVVELCTTTSDTVHFLDCYRISPVFPWTHGQTSASVQCVHPPAEPLSRAFLAVCWQFGVTPALPQCGWLALVDAQFLNSGRASTNWYFVTIGSTASPDSQLYKT